MVPEQEAKIRMMLELRCGELEKENAELRRIEIEATVIARTFHPKTGTELDALKKLNQALKVRNNGNI
jgi:hypothetical protein